MGNTSCISPYNPTTAFLVRGPLQVLCAPRVEVNLLGTFWDSKMGERALRFSMAPARRWGARWRAYLGPRI